MIPSQWTLIVSCFKDIGVFILLGSAMVAGFMLNKYIYLICSCYLHGMLGCLSGSGRQIEPADLSAIYVCVIPPSAAQYSLVVSSEH